MLPGSIPFFDDQRVDMEHFTMGYFIGAFYDRIYYAEAYHDGLSDGGPTHGEFPFHGACCCGK